MATASNPSPPPPPPPSSIGATNVAPNISRPPRGGFSSPWAHIVRSSTSSPNAAPINAVSIVSPSSASSTEKIADNVKPVPEPGNDSGSGSNVDAVVGEVQSAESNGGKKPVWNRPSQSITPVMGGVMWPALSESTKCSIKSASSEFIRNALDGSPSVSQGTGMFSPSSHLQGVGSNVNPAPIPNHATPSRQRPNRRVNGGDGVNSSNTMSSNRGFSQAPQAQGSEVEVAPNNAGKSSNYGGEPSAKENMHREGGGQRGGSGSQSHAGGEHQQRTSYRRGSNGPHPRDGSQHHSHGGRRDHERGNQDWNPHRNFVSRDAQTQPQRGSSRPFFRGPSHANTTYIAPPPIAVRPPFVAPMVYPGPEVPTPVFYAPGPHMDPFRGVPLVAPIGPVYFPFGDPHLHMKIVNQIEYYFSNANIVKDTYLRRNMDEQGWVPIKLIAGFNKVSELTDDVQLILAALQSSKLLEVEGEKVRRREDWPNWLIPTSAQHSATSSPQSTPKSGNGMLAEHLQNLVLNDDNIPSRSSSGEFSSR